MTWLQATFTPTTLFSLKPSWATSTGGKTLLVPSPYAIKMALLDGIIRCEGKAKGETEWPFIRDLSIAAAFPPHLVVTNLFTKVLKIRRKPAEEGSADAGPFQKTIGYREYVFLSDSLHLLFNEDRLDRIDYLKQSLAQISYLGKRGGFIQLRGFDLMDELNADHRFLTEAPDAFQLNGVMQQLEDCDPKMKFAEADIFNSKRPKRITHNIILPYQPVRSSRAYTMYQRT